MKERSLPGTKAEAGDPEIQKVLTEMGITGVRLRMLFGDHFLTRTTAEYLINELGIKVLTGEFSFDPDPNQYGIDTQGGRRIAEEFLFNLSKLPTGVTGNGQMEMMIQRSAVLQKQFIQNGVMVIADGFPWRVDTHIAGDAALIGWGGLAYLSYLCGARVVSRRNFLKIAACGAGAMATGLTLGAVNNTAKNFGIEPPANQEIGLGWSKIVQTGTEITDQAMEKLGQARLTQAFQALVEVRNKVMALNTWWLMGAIEQNPGLRQAVTGTNGRVDIGFLAGAGHVGAMLDFVNGPQQLAKELTGIVNKWLRQYVYEMSNTPADMQPEVVEYYAGLLSTCIQPRMVTEMEIDQRKGINGQRQMETDTPAAVMYRAVIADKNAVRILEQLIKDRCVADGTYSNVGGTTELAARYPMALKKRFEETRFFPPVDLEDVKGEIYPDLFCYEHYGSMEDKIVRMGLVIVKGMPMTYIPEEDTSFIHEKN